MFFCPYPKKTSKDDDVVESAVLVEYTICLVQVTETPVCHKFFPFPSFKHPTLILLSF